MKEGTVPRIAGLKGGGRLVYSFSNTTTSRQRGRKDETPGLSKPVTTSKDGVIL
jgi:hypothetical protein